MDVELLVRAVIEDQDRFLIAHTKGAANTYLPGGHVQAGEAMKGALARELDEELGVAVEVGEYLGAVEHAWQANGARNHEINHCFAVTSPALKASQLPESREDHVEFFWLQPSEFVARNLQPEPLRQLLTNWRNSPRPFWWGSTIEQREK